MLNKYLVKFTDIYLARQKTYKAIVQVFMQFEDWPSIIHRGEG